MNNYVGLSSILYLSAVVRATAGSAIAPVLAIAAHYTLRIPQPFSKRNSIQHITQSCWQLAST